MKRNVAISLISALLTCTQLSAGDIAYAIQRTHKVHGF